MCSLHSAPKHHLVNIKNASLPMLDFNKSNKRLKIWNLKSRYHCSVLGTCLTLKELRQIAQKAKITEAESMSDYELHVSFVAVLDKKSYISSLVNKKLDKKYKRNIQQLSKAKTNDTKNALWNEAMKAGDVAGAFWALITQAEASEEVLYDAYGKIHMLSHLSGASLRIDMQEFHRLKHRNQELEKQIKQITTATRKKSEAKDKEISQLKLQWNTVKSKNKALLSVQEKLEGIKKSPIIEALQSEINQLKVDYRQSCTNLERTKLSEKSWQQQTIKEQEEKHILKQQLMSSHQEKQALEHDLSVLLGKKDNVVGDCTSCTNTNKDLCGRCVLYIGGRNKQYTHFKELVEQQNGRFVHHDGGRENNRQHLASVVSQADVVLCPLDCVSHNAMNIVKRHCKSHTKPLVFIPHASLAAFSRGLSKVSKRQFKED